MASPAASTIRILVVDDDSPARRYAERVLESGGYETAGAENGIEALKLAQHELPFDLFVVDVMMPEMSGPELARHLRATNPDAKILYVTGYADRLFQEKGSLWEGEAFIEKPTTSKGLLEAVSLLIHGTVDPSPRE